MSHSSCGASGPPTWANISGRVTGQGGEQLAGATVTLSNGMTATNDGNGNYTIAAVKDSYGGQTMKPI